MNRDLKNGTRALLGAACGLLAVAAAAAGCEVAVVDLGSSRADAGPDGSAADAGPVTTSDCPQTTEAEVEALYGHPCSSTCADPDGPPRVVKSSVELVAVTATRWRTCSGEVPWPADVVGIEFQNGCTLFLLHDAPDGGVARGVLPEDQGTFNVNETTAPGGAVTRALELYFPTWTWQVSVTTSDCPHRMRLEGAQTGTTGFVAIPSTSPTPQ